MSILRKINLLIVIFFLLIVFLIVFLIYPLLTEIKNNSQAMVSQKKSLTIFQAKIENLEDFRNFYKDFEKDLQKINNLFIDPKMPIEFIGFLEKTADEHQLIIKISSTSPQKTGKDIWPSLVFQINSVSSSPNLFRFIEKIENSAYLIEIQNLNVNRITSNDPLLNGDVNSNLFIKVYTQ